MGGREDIDLPAVTSLATTVTLPVSMFTSIRASSAVFTRRTGGAVGDQLRWRASDCSLAKGKDLSGAAGPCEIKHQWTYYLYVKAKEYLSRKRRNVEEEDAIARGNTKKTFICVERQKLDARGNIAQGQNFAVGIKS